jgi:2-polyprenyl-6-methoxyphenol hydroxylase-like FAD-dependent oxidoreductase
MPTEPVADVLVVGAGPTGLTLGTELRLAGTSVAVLDASPGPSDQAKGGGIQPRTAELFDLRGMMDPLLRLALPGPRFGGHFGGLPVALDCAPWTTRHPLVAAIPQGRLEAFLSQRLSVQGVTVRRGHRLTDVELHDDRVVAAVHDPVTGADLRLSARYLVACDGAHSTVRSVLDVPFPGEAGTRPAVLAEVRLSAVSDLVPTANGSFGSVVADGGGYWSMLNPLDDGRYRFVFGPLEPAAADHAADPVHPGEVRRALQAVWGADTALAEVLCSSRFSDAIRQVGRYRHGRVLFAGDAAHIHPPLGGQGLNLGVQDAFNLGWKLAAQVQGRAPSGLLDSYHTERHPAAARVLHHVRAQRVLAERTPSADVAALREVVTDLARLPDANRHLAGLVSGLDQRYPAPSGADHPLLGARVPDADLVVEGRATRLSALMHAGHGLLLDLTADGRIARDPRHRGVDTCWAAGEILGAEAMLLRPDGYLCWLSPGGGALADALRQWFGAGGVGEGDARAG